MYNIAVAAHCGLDADFVNVSMQNLQLMGEEITSWESLVPTDFK